MSKHWRSASALVGVSLAFCLALRAWAEPGAPEAGALAAQVAALGRGGFEATLAAVQALAASPDPRAQDVLAELEQGKLFTLGEGGPVLLVEQEGTGEQQAVFDPVTRAALAPVARDALEPFRVNNRLRREIAALRGRMTLISPRPEERRKAAEAVLKRPDVAAIAPLAHALKSERDPGLRALLKRAHAAALLASEAADGEKMAAIHYLAEQGDRGVLHLLAQTAATPGRLAEPAREAHAQLERRLAFWAGVQNVIYGLSLGSVLLLAATGLAISFGVMGVINMAHGELVMLGAYAAYLAQRTLAAWAPDWVPLAPLLALPLAFSATALLGFGLERAILQRLYSRPLETLLATWGISLFLQQGVRSLFGASNVEVSSPSWLSGSIGDGLLTLTWSRLWIIVVALLVFASLQLLLRRTSFGLHLRATVENRPIASALGIRTRRIDSWTFALSCGIAGLAGVPLSQIDNVSPNLGHHYIIDSFMVVVFGGVGNLWGTLVAAFSLGIVSKLSEPYAGAVVGKILVLVFIVIFIQRRPRGLFALRGRAQEA